MKNYIFIWGRDPDLSLLELQAYLKARNIEYKIISSQKEGLIVSMEKQDFNSMIKILGGTIKIAGIFNPRNDILYDGEKNKIRYGLSYYNSNLNLRSLIKSRLKKERIKGTLKTSKRKDTFLSPSESMKILGNGFEIIVLKNQIGKLIACFDPKSQEQRDKSRPMQRPLQMISIRLAKILINLAGAKENDSLLDPFCGIGVLLQEAIYMNINVLGLDINQRCVDDSNKNLKWMKKQFHLKNSFKVIRFDSTRLSKVIKKVDAVATEPYLGPLLKKLPTGQEANKILNNLKPIYSNLLNELKKVVKGKVAIIIPRFRLHNGKRIKMDFIKLINRSGFTASRQFPIIYNAVKSKIEREIWVLEKR
ncbi:MAG: DNA methyltransferase [Nanoarchaeota archaeon]|nr:DNA methyltransferase [Nanoarchaeota archaeon]